LVVILYGDELAFNSFKFDKFGDLVQMSASAVTRARKQGVGKKSKNSIDKPIPPSEPFNQLSVKMEVEIEEPLVQIPTIKLSVKKAGKTAGHQTPPTRGAKVLGKAKVQKKAETKKRSKFMGKHPMILRNRVN